MAQQHLPLFACHRILSYAADGGEISPSVLAEKITENICLPRITHYRKREMQFFPAHAGLSKNRYGIPEPIVRGQPIPLRFFDLILLPLVAFDHHGHRLGMGAGFYDRALSIRLQNPSQKRPKLLGLAHHFQQVNSVTPQSWDVPLDAILTDRELIQF